MNIMKSTHAVAALVLVSLMGCGSSVDIAAFDESDGGGSDTGASTTDSMGGEGGTVTDSATTTDSAPADTFDPTADKDGDGYKAIDDCNDDDAKINPGAFDVPDDKIDNDCNGKVDDDGCDDSGLALDSTEPNDFAKAVGICRTTTADATGKSKTWGLVSAKLSRADGTDKVDDVQHGIMTAFGKNVSPKQGKSLLVLSSGTARTPSQPDFVKPAMSSTDDTNVTPAPTGFPKSAPGCPASTSSSAYDGIALELELRVPTNAKGFKLAHDFYTSEYVEQVCKGYDDHFLVLLESTAPLDAKYSGNIVFDAMGNHITSSTPLLEVCTMGMAAGKSWSCPQGTKELEETGFADPDKPANGAATGWLETHTAVVPGETIKVRFVVFDGGDHLFDSSVLLDAFRWTTNGPDLPVTSKASK
ncbi:MAG: putative metal-binding motif-containing protein [Polyangiales bacterium]